MCQCLGCGKAEWKFRLKIRPICSVAFSQMTVDREGQHACAHSMGRDHWRKADDASGLPRFHAAVFSQADSRILRVAKIIPRARDSTRWGMLTFRDIKVGFFRSLLPDGQRSHRQPLMALSKVEALPRPGAKGTRRNEAAAVIQRQANPR